jgi:hypothetical protein
MKIDVFKATLRKDNINTLFNLISPERINCHLKGKTKKAIINKLLDMLVP